MIWQRIIDEGSGKPYYYNAESEVTQWEFPLELLEQALSGIGWARVVSDQNEVYYYSEESGETSWDLPTGILDWVKNDLGNDVTLNEITGSDGTIEEEEEKEEKTDEMEIESEELKPSVYEILSLKELLKDEADTTEFNGLSPEQRKETYFKLLEESNVDKKWSFTKVIKELTSDKRYWCILDPINRQKFFEEYLGKQADEDFQQSSIKSQEYKDNFFKLLTAKNVKYYSQWSTISQLLIDEEIYESIPETFRVEFFIEFTGKLRQDHEIELEQLRNTQLEELKEYLKEVVQITSKFDQMLPEIKTKFPNLSKKDIFICFDTAITVKEGEMDNIYENNKKLNYTYDRKARDAFENVLSIITKSSQLKWVDFLESLKTTPEFIELCGHNGSSPIEYFWDIIDEENIKLRSKRDSIKDILFKKNISIDELSLEQFSSLSKDVADIQVDEISFLYNQLKSNTRVKRSQPEKEAASSSADYYSRNKRFKQY